MKFYQQYMYSYPHKTAYRTIDSDRIKNELIKLSGMPCGLYIHLPFCQAKCGFCNLFSVAGCQISVVDDYLDAIQRQLEQYNSIVPLKSIPFDSLTLGGGTPVYLSTSQLHRLLKLIKIYTGIAPSDVPSAIELSPNQADESKLCFLHKSGFQRVSLGIQSFQDTEISTLYRIHTSKRAEVVLQNIKKIGFPILNIDLIYGIPNQSAESFMDSLKRAASWVPEELFVYPLYIKMGTPLYGRAELDSSFMNQLYHLAKDYLTEQGFFQTSMRRFLNSRTIPNSVFKEPAADRSCGFDCTLSFGCGGRSYLNNLHICDPYTISSIDARKRLLNFNQKTKTDFLEGLSGFQLNTEEQKRRFTVRNLLHYRGLSIKDYENHFHSDVRSDFPFFYMLEDQNYILEIDGRIRLTEVGMGLSDSIGPMFISENVNILSNNFYGNSNIFM